MQTHVGKIHKENNPKHSKMELKYCSPSCQLLFHSVDNAAGIQFKIGPGLHRANFGRTTSWDQPQMAHKSALISVNDKFTALAVVAVADL